jgi:hypothetical protein
LEIAGKEEGVYIRSGGYGELETREGEREGVERAVLTFGVRGFLWFFKVLWGFPIGIGKC